MNWKGPLKHRDENRIALYFEKKKNSFNKSNKWRLDGPTKKNCGTYRHYRKQNQFELQQTRLEQLSLEPYTI
jgi:hypothetical protein